MNRLYLMVCQWIMDLQSETPVWAKRSMGWFLREQEVDNPLTADLINAWIQLLHRGEKDVCLELLKAFKKKHSN